MARRGAEVGPLASVGRGRTRQRQQQCKGPEPGGLGESSESQSRWSDGNGGSEEGGQRSDQRGRLGCRLCGTRQVLSFGMHWESVGGSEQKSDRIRLFMLKGPLRLLD